MRNAKTDVQKDYSTTLNQFTQTPDDKLLAGKLQLGPEITTPGLRRMEIINWVKHIQSN